MKTMKAAVVHSWGTMDIDTVPVPEPVADEALIKLLYCGICGSDIHVYKGEHPTARPPCPMGHEMIGIVERINSERKLPFKIGDRVAMHSENCGRCEFCLEGNANQCRTRTGTQRLSAGFAQYMTRQVSCIAPLPPHIPDEVATLTEPFTVAVRTTDRSGLRIGDTVCIVGSGNIGFVIALMCREKGASNVVITGHAKERLDFAKAYGFETIDQTQTDLESRIMEITDGRGVDVTIDASGSVKGMQITPRITCVEGTIVSLSVGLPLDVFDTGLIALKELTIIGSRAHHFREMQRAVIFMDNFCKRYDLRNLISNILPLDDVKTGFDMMVEKRSAGKIIIKCN